MKRVRSQSQKDDNRPTKIQKIEKSQQSKKRERPQSKKDDNRPTKMQKVSTSLDETRSLIKDLKNKQQEMKKKEKEMKKMMKDLRNEEDHTRWKKLKLLKKEDNGRIIIETNNKEEEQNQLSNLWIRLPKEIYKIIVKQSRVINPSFYLCSKKSLMLYNAQTQSKTQDDLDVIMDGFLNSLKHWRTVNANHEWHPLTHDALMKFKIALSNLRKTKYNIYKGRTSSLWSALYCAMPLVKKLDTLFKKIDDSISNIKYIDISVRKEEYPIEDPTFENFDIIYEYIKSRKETRYTVNLTLNYINDWINFLQMKFLDHNIRILGYNLIDYYNGAFKIRYSLSYNVLVCIRFLPNNRFLLGY